MKGKTPLTFTGSGKTYTMEAIEHRIARDLFPISESLPARFLASHRETQKENVEDGNQETSNIFEVTVTFLELLGKRASDLVEVTENFLDENENEKERKEVVINENKVNINIYLTRNNI
jgi:kinesin family member 2/24